MSPDHRPGFTPNLVVGAGIMLLGLVLVLDRMGVVHARELLRLWPVLLIVFGASVVAQALRGGDRPSSDSRDGQTETLPLVMLLVIAFLFVSYVESRREVRTASPGMATASLFAVMGRDEQTAPAQPFGGGEITTIMGRTHLDLRQAVIGPGEEAVVHVLGLMGRVVVHVPGDWVVDVQTTAVAARVRSDRPEAPTGVQVPLPADVLERPDPPARDPRAPPRVVLRGYIVMGALVIAS